MQYRKYTNGASFLWMGIILLLLFGGVPLVVKLFGLGLSLIVNMAPVLILIYFFYGFGRRVQTNSTIGSGLSGTTLDHQRFTELLVRTLCHVMLADGTLHKSERQAVLSFFKNRLRYSQSKLIWVHDLIDHAAKDPVPLQELCQEFSSLYAAEAKLLLLQLVYEIAYADGHFHPQEEKLIRQVVDYLAISESDHTAIRQLFGLAEADNREKYAAILGVSPTASAEEIKRAYREASKRFHPDKVFHLGEEYRKVAEEKMQKINDAYQKLS